jgi:hypothetical protein
VLWAVASWEQWAAYELAVSEGTGTPWQKRNRELTTSLTRILLVDAPLSPLRLGRQPQRADRTEEWDA